MTTGQTTPADTPIDTPNSERQTNENYSISNLSVAEKQLQDLLNKRENLQKHLASIENSLYNLETSYIDEVTYGNVVRGYEGYLTARTPSARRQQRPIETDRIFSSSSITFQKVEREMTPQYDSPDPNEYNEDGEYGAEKVKRKKKEVGSSRKKRVVHSDDD